MTLSFGLTTNVIQGPVSTEGQGKLISTNWQRHSGSDTVTILNVASIVLIAHTPVCAAASIRKHSKDQLWQHARTGGFFVVLMNALLQRRGHVLLSAGHSIVVQNFNEQLNILLMVTAYSVMLPFGLHINIIIVIFSSIVAVLMIAIMYWNHVNHRNNPTLNDIIGMEKHETPDEFLERPKV